MAPNNAKYSTALYMRLSQDDENFGDSVSIETQRKVLRQYASENNLIVYDEYVDDGWSGTNFERPAFQRMMSDIEAGKVNCVVTKDLSRFGREHIMSIGMRANDRLISCKMFAAKFLAQRLRAVNRQTVLNSITRVKTDYVVVGFDVAPTAIFAVMQIRLHTGSSKIIFATIQGHKTQQFSRGINLPLSSRIALFVNSSCSNNRYFSATP